MTDPESIEPVKRRPSLCCISWLLVLTALLSFYVFKAIQFEGKVRTFNNKIELGMRDLDVLKLLGRYSRIDRGFPPGESLVIVEYNGKPFLREDIILLFDPISRKLVSKERAMSFHMLVY